MTPEEWLRHLAKTLSDRSRGLDTLDAYYRGDHPLAFASRQFREAFGGLFDGFADNWCSVVVDATEERLNVVGFRFDAGDQADTDAWGVWQANQLDSESGIAHTEALVHSEAYALVWPGDPVPRITIEHPLQMVTASSPADRRRTVAALKRYVDEDRFEVAYLYLPGVVYRFRSERPLGQGQSPGDDQTKWVPEDRDVEDPAEQRNPFGDVVPVVPIQNRPRLIRPPRSEIELVLPLQNAVNKLWADMLVASEFTADAQRYLLGWEPEVDPDTGERREIPWRRQDRLWFIPPTDVTENAPQFGQFQPGDLSGYLQAIETAVNHIASMTRTPPHYLSPSADRLSGESIKASESGLVSKVRRKMVTFGEAWEQVMRLAFVALGDTARAAFVGAETVWADPEIRSEAEVTDSTVKRVSIGLPLEQAWEDLGYSPTQVARMRAMRAAEGALGGEDATTARDVAELLSKVTAAVTAGVISDVEARDLANRAGAGLTGPAPAQPPAPVSGG